MGEPGGGVLGSEQTGVGRSEEAGVQVGVGRAEEAGEGDAGEAGGDAVRRPRGPACMGGTGTEGSLSR